MDTYIAPPPPPCAENVSSPCAGDRWVRFKDAQENGMAGRMPPRDTWAGPSRTYCTGRQNRQKW